MTYELIKLTLSSFSRPQFSILIISTILISIWLSYYLLFLSKNEIKVKKSIFHTYSLYLLFINIWVISNAFFQSEFLSYFDSVIAKEVGLIANISSLLSANFTFLFSCLLVRANKPLKKHQSYTFIFGIIVSLVMFLYPELTIVDVVITSTGHFTITLGKASSELFIFGFILLILTFRNFYLYRKSQIKINKTKSNYMMFGMSIFMVSTLICHIIIPSVSNDYSATWIPPALSIFEQVLVGYAIFNDRFYSLRYITHLSISYLLNILLYLSPIVMLTHTDPNEYHFILIGCWIIISGICWKNSLAAFQRYINRFIYGSPSNTVNDIHSLVNDFKQSSDMALNRVKDILNSNTGQIIKVGINSSQSELANYLEAHNEAILKDELDYFIEYHSSDIEKLTKIRNSMAENDSALVLPIFNNNVITHLFMVSKKNEGGIFSQEEISALQLVLEQSNKFIYAEDEIRKSQLLAGSIAHEMKNPLSKIQYHFERIDADLFDLDTSSLVPYASSEMKTLYQNICEVKSAVQLGSKFIEVILNELQGGRISPDSFRLFSARELIKQSLNDYNFEHASSRHLISLDPHTDFIFKGDDTLYSFIIFNLLNNSLHYISEYPEMKISIRLSTGDRHNKVIFTDTGPGINASRLPYIFDEMYTSGKNNGNGLGLAYCQRVMTAFGGNISCRSEAGKFTEFTLSFPTINSAYDRETVQRFKRALKGKYCLLVGEFSSSLKLTVLLYELNIKITKVESIKEMMHILSFRHFDFVFINEDITRQSANAIKSIRCGELGSIAQITPIISCTNNGSTAKSYEGTDNLIQGVIDTREEELLISLQHIIENGQLKPLGNLIGKKVLVVDDMLVNRLLIKGYLENEGIICFQAENGKKAVEIVMAEEIDFILMDIRMPVMNGFEATKEIRKISPSTPIVALTGEYGEDVATTITLTMEDHLTKPITKKRLLQKINKHLKDTPLSLRNTRLYYSAM